MKTSMLPRLSGLHTAAAISLAALAAGCVSGASSSAGGAGGSPAAGAGQGAGAAAATSTLIATGSFSATISGASGSLDLTGMKVTAALTHKISSDAKAATCVPLVTLAAEKDDGTCKLSLEFKPGYTGTELELASAKFFATTGVKDDKGVVLQLKPCSGWVKEPDTKFESIYENAGGAGKLAMPILTGAAGTQKSAVIKAMEFAPEGKVMMKYKGRSFEFDLSALKFKGDATSTGSADAAVSCQKTTFDMPGWLMADINPVTETYKQEIGLDNFKGKRIVVLLGAGWCSSCVSQGKSMEKIRASLAASGKTDVAFVVINDKSANNEKDQKTMSDKLNLPVVQATATVDGWAMQKGGKNDGFFYDYNGQLLGKFQGAGTVYTNSWEDWISKNIALPKGDSAGYDCKEGGKTKFEEACTKRAE